MIEWIVLGIVGFVVVILLISPSSRNRGSRDYIRTQRPGENAEQKMELDRDLAREKERRRYGGSRF